MLIVKDDPEAVEADLAAGRLHCPSCPDKPLARWGFARRRELRGGTTLRLSSNEDNELQKLVRTFGDRQKNSYYGRDQD